MCRTLVLVAVALALSSPAAMAEASQAKPAQRPATKKPAPAKPAPAAAPAPKPEPPPPPPPPPGVKMTTAYTQGAQVSQNTTYLQGARQRVEFPGVVTLDQCDLKRSLLLNTDGEALSRAALSRTKAGSGDGRELPIRWPRKWRRCR